MKLKNPPFVALMLFRWFCHPNFREEIEGDLLESYHKNIQQFGRFKANVVFCKEVFLLFRPAIIGNLHHLTFNLFLDMKKMHWIQLTALNIAVALCVLLPFLPGPYDKLSWAVSVMGQLTGYVGLLLVPIGVLWLIQEIKKLTSYNNPTNHWSSGYYYAITATIVYSTLSLFFALVLLISVGISASIMALIILGIVLYQQVLSIKKLKNAAPTIFNATPLYLLSIPIIAFTVSSFLISPASEYSRNYAIRQGETLIAAIEDYREQKGSYPPSIEYVNEVPKPSVMGVDAFIYELNGDSYNLSFIQHQHLGATREVVMYNKHDEHNVKGHFANFATSHHHWKYYWLD